MPQGPYVWVVLSPPQQAQLVACRHHVTVHSLSAFTIIVRCQGRTQHVAGLVYPPGQGSVQGTVVVT